jgi:hypothetical protein
LTTRSQYDRANILNQVKAGKIRLYPSQWMLLVISTE